jgi:hypothetical protein
MKTPREILLARHQAAIPQLDAIRQSVVAELNRPATRKQNFLASLVAGLRDGSNPLWRELVWPCRRIWTGLAVIWILIFAVNFSQRDRTPATLAKSTPTAGMMMTFRDQQKMLNELFADRSLPAEAERPRIFSPKPRTETTKLLTA